MSFDAAKMTLPESINPHSWLEWVEYRRKEKRKKVTEAAANKQLKLLSKHSFDVQSEIIETSIMNDYQGLFPPKVQHETRRPNIRQTTSDRIREQAANVCESTNRETSELVMGSRD